jgi:hypothetical protein
MRRISQEELSACIGFSARKSRNLNSKLHRNAKLWENRDPVEQKRGLFKNLTYNPCGYTIKRKEPLKQRGCLLVNRHSLRASIGKRRSSVPESLDLGPQEEGPTNNYAFVISDGRLKLKNYECKPAKAYNKNLAFLQGGRKSCRQLKYVARFITDYGITKRLYRKLSLAAMLVIKGKANAASQIYRSVANRCGQLRYKAEHALFVREPSLSDSSLDSDW